MRRLGSRIGGRRAHFAKRRALRYKAPMQTIPRKRGAAALLLLATLGTLAPPAAAQIKRWVDERGVVHYSDAPPPPRAPAAGAVTELPPMAPPSPTDRAAAAQRLQHYREQLTEPAQLPASGASAAAPRTHAASAPAASDQSCAAQWARYHAAYACMEPYRMVDGRIRPEAFQRCPVVAQPSCPQPGSQ